MFVRSLFKLPGSTPTPALIGLIRLMGMRQRIWKWKLELVRAIQQSGETLAKEILEEQTLRGFPGLAVEAAEICKEIGITNIIEEDVAKEDINDAICWHNQRSIKEEMESLKKCKYIKNKDLRKRQDFMEEFNLEQCRMMMRISTRMVECTGNMPRLFKGREGCIGCSPRRRGEQGPEELETQDHMELCKGYVHCWGESSNELEKAKYFIRVMKRRTEMKMEEKKKKERNQ